MADLEIVCPMCGFSNPADAVRCHSCGAKVETVQAHYTDEEVAARRHQQENFEWKWALVATGIYLVMQTLILILLPKMISSFDPQGLPGLMLSVLVWFLGGIAVGVISPGKTFVEPAAGALIAVAPTIGYLAWSTPDGFQPSMLAYIVTALLGVMISLFGAFIGEKVQMNKPKPTAKA
jgi:hypothetical protein